MSPRELSELLLRGLALYERIRDATRPDDCASEVAELEAIAETLQGIDRKSTIGYSEALPELNRRLPNSPPLEGFNVIDYRGQVMIFDRIRLTSWHEAAIQFLKCKIFSMSCLVSVKESLIESEEYPSELVVALCYAEAEILNYFETESAEEELSRLNAEYRKTLKPHGRFLVEKFSHWLYDNDRLSKRFKDQRRVNDLKSLQKTVSRMLDTAGKRKRNSTE